MKLTNKVKEVTKSNFFNIRYLFNPPWDSGIPAPELIEFIYTQPPGRALDLGCGTGTNLIALLERGWQADGVDFSWLAVHKAKRKVRKLSQNSLIICSKVTDLVRLKHKYDLILDIGCYHSLSQGEKELYNENIARFLRPSGTFLMYAFLKQPDGNFGISDLDIKKIEEFLVIVSKTDGFDKGEKPSTWIRFKPNISF